MSFKFFKSLLLISILIHPVFAYADPQADLNNQFNTILKENDSKLTYGPATVNLGTQASIKIDRGEVFVPPDVAKQLFSLLGRKDLTNMLGLLIPGLPGDEVPTDDWGAVALQFDPIGYVSDDDAKSWDYPKLLEQNRKHIEETNIASKDKGLPERELVGWIEKPKYDPTTHRLLWATAIQNKGKPETSYSIYSTATLGREGILTFTFGTPTSKESSRKDIAATILSGIEFNPGKRYTDFAQGTDKVAAIGLAALIGGVVAKKLGLFALLAVALVKWGKILALGVISVLAVFRIRKKTP